MFKNVTTNYTGGDATMEIIVMLFVAFILGFLMRWIWDKFHGCVEEYEEFIIEEDNDDNNDKKDDDSKNKKASVTHETVIHETIPQQKSDDLKIIEGIGPKIESILKDAHINTWKELSETNEETIRSILKNAGDNFAFHNPKTWPEQAKLADQGKWEELEEFQDFLNGGRE